MGDIGKSIRRTAKKLSRGLDDIGKSFEKAANKTWETAKTGQIFGDSQWGNYFNNITGARTTADLVGQARRGEHVEFHDAKNAARKMRPTMAYSDAAGI